MDSSLPPTTVSPRRWELLVTMGRSQQSFPSVHVVLRSHEAVVGTRRIEYAEGFKCSIGTQPHIPATQTHFLLRAKLTSLLEKALV